MIGNCTWHITTQVKSMQLQANHTYLGALRGMETQTTISSGLLPCSGNQTPGPIKEVVQTSGKINTNKIP